MQPLDLQRAPFFNSTQDSHLLVGEFYTGTHPPKQFTPNTENTGNVVNTENTGLIYRQK